MQWINNSWQLKQIQALYIFHGFHHLILRSRATWVKTCWGPVPMFPWPQARLRLDKICTHVNSSVCNRCCSWTCCTSCGLKVNWISIDSDFFFRFGPEKIECFFLGLPSWLSTTLTDRMLTLSPNCSAAIDMASLSMGESENSAGRLLVVFFRFRCFWIFPPPIWLDSGQGYLLKGIDNKTVRR